MRYKFLFISVCILFIFAYINPQNIQCAQKTFTNNKTENINIFLSDDYWEQYVIQALTLLKNNKMSRVFDEVYNINKKLSIKQINNIPIRSCKKLFTYAYLLHKDYTYATQRIYYNLSLNNNFDKYVIEKYEYYRNNLIDPVPIFLNIAKNIGLSNEQFLDHILFIHNLYCKFLENN